MEKIICKKLSKIEKEFLIAIGEKIKTARQSQGMTKGKLSKLSRISYGFLNNIELGKVDIDIITLNKLSLILKLSHNDIYS